ncbi:hypothetical protein MA16_Dca017885 [Dendrobium catenatum]|uniref:Uncharacterized protein n=1 Tax=Dendrobium catenatum TaxID=906689 RepID=A0A2I0W9Q5_9ASPA|nr:hypothetical protein MA16_Dca017885 [Dendrobium catenatum]
MKEKQKPSKHKRRILILFYYIFVYKCFRVSLAIISLISKKGEIVPITVRGIKWQHYC